ncbi:MAG: T9SS type A sorting domain-containing protein [Bacteroidetes bacterium]|nr:T9SS type A sorting domain-containing protein [Bacteroidota bacterium]
MTKKVNIFLVFFIHLAFQNYFAQVPAIQWQKSVGGTYYDYSYAIVQAADSGFVFAGSSSSNTNDIPLNYGLDDYVLVKTNYLGVIQWEHSYGGSDYDVAYCVNKTNDGGYILCGQASSNNIDLTVNYGDSDYWIVKTNSLGVMQWQRSYGGSGEDNGSWIIQTNDGGYIISGYATSNNVDVTNNHGLGDYWTVKTNSLGVIQWQKTYGGSSLDYGGKILQTTDGGYIICGTSKSNDGDVSGNHGLEDYWIVKTSNLGVIQWQKSYGGSGNDYGQDIKQTSDGGYIVCGKSNSTNGDINDNHGNNDYWVVKIDNLGTIQWKKSYGGSLFDNANSVIQTTDGGYLIAGQSNSIDGDKTFTNGSYDNWLVKVNSAGTIVWTKDFGGSAYEDCKALIPTLDGSYAVCGESISNDVDVSGNHGGDDMWVVKFNSPLGIKENKISNTVSFFPNPSKNEITINAQKENEFVLLTIEDLFGKTVYSSPIDGQTTFNFNLENGVYLLRIKEQNNKEAFTKLIISK